MPETLAPPAPDRSATRRPPSRRLLSATPSSIAPPGAARRRRAAARRRVALSIAGAAAIPVLFLTFQALLIGLWAGGPSFDEGIYLTAGERTLSGHGVADGYLGWFAGSLLWPVLSALGASVAGLEGARLVAALFVTAAVIGTWRAAANLFGERSGLFAAGLFATAGPVLALGHLAVYDTVALAGVAGSLWCVTELARRDHRAWLLGAGACFALAILAKYPAAFCLPPLVAVLIVLRGRRAAMDIMLLAAALAAVLIPFFLAFRFQLADFLAWRPQNNPSFGVRWSSMAFSQAYVTAVPLVLAALGWAVARGRRLVATPLLAAGLIFPAYHLITASSVGDTKHVTFGLVFLMPLAGKALASGSRRRVATPLVVAAFAAWMGLGAVQLRLLDSGWADVRPATALLAAEARPGDTYLIDNSWPFTRALLDAGKVASPWQVYDVYRVEHGQLKGSVCDARWFVAAQGAAQWPQAMHDRIAACGTFRKVYDKSVPVTNIGSHHDFVTYDAAVTVWRNEALR